MQDSREVALLALQVAGDRVGLAWLALASGRFRILESEASHLASELERLQPAELVVPDDLQMTLPAGLPLKRLPSHQFDFTGAARELAKQFQTRDLSGFGCDGLPLAVGAAGALLAYVKHAQQGALPPHHCFERRAPGRLRAHGCRDPAQSRDH